jgi:hypothetical protein
MVALRRSIVSERRLVPRVALGLLGIAAAGAAIAGPGPEASVVEGYDSLAALEQALPAPAPQAFDRQVAETLAMMGIACLDDPESPPANLPYLWQPEITPVHDYQSQRAFYGCLDWHSDVNTTWAMVRILKIYPDLPIAPLLRAKLEKHLGASNVAGELAYFSKPELAHTWMRPYGFAWVLRLQYELRSWNDPDARRWAAHLQPFAAFVSHRLAEYFTTNPDQPVRTGAHFNTALAYRNSIDYASHYDPALDATILRLANRYYGRDINCNTDNELGATDFLSPCLTEAALMARVLDRSHYVAWLDRFLPPLNSKKFWPLTQTIDPTKSTSRAARSHYLGLGLTRAACMLEIANALPLGDARVPVLRKLAGIHADAAFALLGAVGYDGTHYASAMAMMYVDPLLSDR